MTARSTRGTWRVHYVELAREFAELGATDDQLARFFGIDTIKLSEWKNKRKYFRAAIEQGRELATALVERRLFERATGYTFDNEKIFCNQDGDVTRVDIKEHCPPDVRAAEFWLKNRAPERWADRKEVKVQNEGFVLHVHRRSDALPAPSAPSLPQRVPIDVQAEEADA